MTDMKPSSESPAYRTAQKDPRLKKMLDSYFRLAALPHPNAQQFRRLEILEHRIKFLTKHD